MRDLLQWVSSKVITALSEQCRCVSSASFRSSLQYVRLQSSGAVSLSAVNSFQPKQGSVSHSINIHVLTAAYFDFFHNKWASQCKMWRERFFQVVSGCGSSCFSLCPLPAFQSSSGASVQRLNIQLSWQQWPWIFKWMALNYNHRKMMKPKANNLLKHNAELWKWYKSNSEVIRVTEYIRVCTCSLHLYVQNCELKGNHVTADFLSVWHNRNFS